MTKSSETQNPNVQKVEHSSVPEALLEVFKQFDDLFMYGFGAIFRGVIPAVVLSWIAAFLSAVVGVLVSADETYEAVKDTLEAYVDPSIGQYKTRMTVGTVSAGLGLAGIGLSVAGLAGFLGASVLGLTYIPILFSACLLTICGLKLERNSYIFHMAKQAEEQAENEYQTSLVKVQACQECINTIEAEKSAMYRQIMFNELSEYERYTKLQTYVSHTQKLELLKSHLESLQSDLDIKKENRSAAQDLRRKAERDVTYATFEAAAATLIFVSTIIGAGLLIGLGGAATFGALPAALLFTGIIFGAATKIIEKVDQHYDYSLSANLRAWIVSKWNNLFHKENNHTQEKDIAREKITASLNEVKFTPTNSQPIPGSSKKEAMDLAFAGANFNHDTSSSPAGAKMNAGQPSIKQEEEIELIELTPKKKKPTEKKQGKEKDVGCFAFLRGLSIFKPQNKKQIEPVNHNRKHFSPGPVY